MKKLAKCAERMKEKNERTNKVERTRAREREKITVAKFWILCPEDDPCTSSPCTQPHQICIHNSSLPEHICDCEPGYEDVNGTSMECVGGFILSSALHCFFVCVSLPCVLASLRTLLPCDASVSCVSFCFNSFPNWKFWYINLCSFNYW